MLPEFQMVFREAREAHSNAVKAEADLRELIMKTPDEKELADAAYALRESYLLFDDAKKRLRLVGLLAEKMASLVAAASFVDTIRTDYVTATPKPHIKCSVPSRKADPDAWQTLMKTIGVPEDLLYPQDEEGSPALDTHWPGMMALLSKRQAMGLPLPPGIDPQKMVTEYSLILHKKKGVTE